MFFNKNMLFRKNIEPNCTYCSHSVKLDDEFCSCKSRGVVKSNYRCRKFKYDALKRTPPKPAQLGKRFDPNDFNLD